ncbi:hypothetical protein [Deinococcus yavapaiensis]|uniref:Uncharacterized protein n=1 Tax=Deinococcus yavapaiensis KR-236 TaxID=694435 RepID=A0A318SDJ6_9DEIO|nr:hypothetical protein [Deinococcus yavapaiensis]PYE54519.1 hypothetical protein DES52_105157 [Deinococcus yavapaiensis KR-236]
MTTSELSNFQYGAPRFLLGYGVGTALYFLISGIGTLLLTDPCKGHTFLAIIIPTILGPGGLGLTALLWRRGWGMFGVGMAVAALFPALFVGSRALEYLKEIGCAPIPPGFVTPQPGTNPFRP